MGTLGGRQVRFRIYPGDHPPIHAHGRIGSAEFIVERLGGRVSLSRAHETPVRGNLTENEVARVIDEASELYDEIVEL